MAKFYNPSESEDAIRLIIPARQRIARIVVLPVAILVISFAVLWWAYQWLSTSSMWRQGASQICAMVLVVVDIALIRALSLEVAVTRLTFERTTIESKKSILGMTISRQWYSCYRVRQFFVRHDQQRPDVVRLDFVTAENTHVLLAADMPTDCFIQLGHMARRKQFAYFKQEIDER